MGRNESGVEPPHSKIGAARRLKACATRSDSRHNGEGGNSKKQIPHRRSPEASDRVRDDTLRDARGVGKDKAVSRVYPAVKYALGFGDACAMVRVAGESRRG